MASSVPNHAYQCEEQGCLSCFNDDGKSQKLQTLSIRNNGNPEMKQTEEFLASEMNQLSVQERSNALDDIHCVGEELNETPAIFQKALTEFAQTVHQGGLNSVYESALLQNRAYVEDPSFRLKFLRANTYDVGKAVRQMMSFLQQKAKYFGIENVARELCLSDLTSDDIQLMRSGLFHIQDGRDRKGRLILHMFSKKLSGWNTETFVSLFNLMSIFLARNGLRSHVHETFFPLQVRVCYYMWWNIMIPLPEVQIKGLVTVYHDDARPGEEFKMPGLNTILNAQSLSSSLPVRYSAMHYCLQTSTGNLGLNNALLGLLISGLPRSARVRTRLHYGSFMELQYSLRSHGIPSNTLPVDVQGILREDILNLWFDKHVEECSGKLNGNCGYGQASLGRLTIPNTVNNDIRISVDVRISVGNPSLLARGVQNIGSASHNMQANSVSADGLVSGDNIDEVKSTDVLFGKGFRLQSHPGNVHFREFLERHKDEYETTPRHLKLGVSARLIQALANEGTRFLQEKESGQWVESDPSLVRKKVAQYYRDFRKRAQKDKARRHPF